LLHDQPERDGTETADRVTRDVLIISACLPTRPRRSAVDRFLTSTS
jgi:hypothetical protein